MEEQKNAARKYAIKNAHEHSGKAQAGAVTGKLKALFPEIEMKDAGKIAALAASEVNKLSTSEIAAEYEKYSKEGWELARAEKEKTLPELEWLKKGDKLITRVAPNPSGVMHFGHARPAVLTDEYVKKYGGKLILRFDDTDPKIKIPLAGAEKDFIKDFEWLGIKFSETANSSDRLDRYYEVIEELLAKGKAYVCDCDGEEWRTLIWESKACPCRGKNPAVQLEQWKKMLAHKIKEEEAVVRIKTDLKNPDPSTRDWWLAKVVDKPEHPNPKTKGKHVWASYNLASAVDDHDMKINFIIRGQEHRQNEDKQKDLYDFFGWVYPHCYYHGKISKLGDMTLSKSKMKEIMDELGVEKYDDPRMATIKSFRRRGFTAQAIRKIILDSGLSLKEIKITAEMLAAANKEVLGEAKEYPFFLEPVKIKVQGAAEGNAEEYGQRVKIKKGLNEFTVEKKEIQKHKKAGTLIRLKKGLNAKIEIVSENGAIAEFVSYDKTNYPIISWVGEGMAAEVIMGDGTIRKGVTSKSAAKAKGIIHFEGLGYANIEEISKDKIKCVYSYE